MEAHLDVLVAVELEHIAALLVDQQPTLVHGRVVQEVLDLFWVAHRQQLAHRAVVCE